MKTLSRLALILVFSHAAGCAGFSITPDAACDPDGNCVPGIEFDFDICPGIPPVFVPPGHPCPVEPIEFPDPEDPEEGDVTINALINLLLSISSPNGVTFTSSGGQVTAEIESSSGTVVTSTPWHIIAGKVTFADKTHFGQWLETNVTGSAHTLRLGVDDVSFSIIGSSSGEIPFTVKLEKDGATLVEVTETFDYEAPASPPNMSYWGNNHFVFCHQPACALWDMYASGGVGANYFEIRRSTSQYGTYSNVQIETSIAYFNVHGSDQNLYWKVCGVNGAGVTCSSAYRTRIECETGGGGPPLQ